MRNRFRLTVQLLFTIVTNGYLYGFLNGKIYRGGLKYVCVPGLNCYSCPIGALQALLNQRGFQVPFVALGFFFVFGSVLGALPLLSTNEALRSQAGGLFLWKLGILLGIVLLSVKVYRPFCQYLCPLGAIYGWFNRFSLVQIHWERERCVSCGACERACPVALSVQEISRSPECIRCGKCADACPQGCLHFTGRPGYNSTKSQSS